VTDFSPIKLLIKPVLQYNATTQDIIYHPPLNDDITNTITSKPFTEEMHKE